MRGCDVSGCENKHLAKGLCCKHYQRLQTWGDVNHSGVIRGDVNARFDSYVELIPFSTCHWWTGTIKETGYGRFHVKDRFIAAHRFSYEKEHGPIPSGLCVCHSCDNPSCVNPDHLWLGTQKNNMQDCSAKSRAGKSLGVNHGLSKLNDEAVKVIRFFAGSVSNRRIAVAYGVSSSTVDSVVKAETWGHV